MVKTHPKVYEIFKLLGFSQFFRFRDSFEEAIDFFMAEPTEKLSVFPVTVSCPFCSRKLKAVKSGRFRCTECKNILAISDTAQVLLG